jgi:hypothetical protein
VSPDVAVTPDRIARCACGGRRRIDWSHGRAPKTDLGPERYNHATNQWHRSQREADMAMAKICRDWSAKTGKHFEAYAAGDKVGGARNETRQTHAAFGYAGQQRRTSTAEVGGAKSDRIGVRSMPAPVDRSVNGIAPRSVTREELRRVRESKVWQ